MKLLNKKILIISYLYPPTVGGGGVMRVVKFSKYLQQLGWQVHVLTAKRHDNYMADESLLKDVEGIKIYESRDLLREFVGFLKKFQISKKNISVNIENKKKKSLISKLKNILYDIICIPEETVSWMKPAVKKGIDIVRKENIDIVFSTSPPFSDHIVGLKVKEKTNIPLVIDFRDRWVGNDYYKAETRLRKKLNINLERKISQNADCIVTTTKNQEKHFADEYNIERIQTIHNGYDESDFNEEHLKNSNKEIIITHLGRLTGGRTVRILANSLKELEDYELKKLKIHFYGLMDDENMAGLENDKIKNSIEIYGMVKHSEAIKAMKESDILLSLQCKEEDGFNAIPAKIFEYMRSETPVLSLSPVKSALWNLVEAENVGFNCDCENKDQIKKALREIINLYDNKKLRKNNNKENIKKFERKELTKKLNNLLCEVIDI